jgi:hypothetical protein
VRKIGNPLARIPDRAETLKESASRPLRTWHTLATVYQIATSWTPNRYLSAGSFAP